MNSSMEPDSEFDVVAGVVAEEPVMAEIAPPDFWQRNGLNKTWVAVGGIVVGSIMFFGIGFVALIAMSVSTPQPNPYGNYSGYGQQGYGMNPYGGAGIQRLPDGGYIDSQGGWGSGTGMSSGAIDQSGGGNHVFSSDGEVLTLPY